jgi:hypothetical protein
MTLALARQTVLLLFCCSVLLPTVVVLRRDARDAPFEPDGSDALRASDTHAVQRALPQQQQLAQRSTALVADDAVPTSGGTRVLVFLVRESGSAMELHLHASDAAGVRDVCAGVNEEDESYRAAAARILWACAALGPPPDIEFLERADKTTASVPLAPGAAAPFVALVRSERLLLRGSAAATQVRQRARRSVYACVLALTRDCSASACRSRRCRPPLTTRQPMRGATRPACRSCCPSWPPSWHRGAGLRA